MVSVQASHDKRLTTRTSVEACDKETQAPDFLLDFVEHKGRVLTARKPGPSLPIYDRLHTLRRTIDRLWEGIAQAEEAVLNNQGKGTSEGTATAAEWRRICAKYKRDLAAAEDEFWKANVPDDENERLRRRNDDRTWRKQAQARKLLDRLSRVVSPAENPRPERHIPKATNLKALERPSKSKETPKSEKSVAPRGPSGQTLTVVAQENSDRRVLKGPTGGEPQKDGKVSH